MLNFYNYLKIIIADIGTKANNFKDIARYFINGR